MKSDITLTHGDKTLIIDTKYYSHTMQKNTMFNSQTIISANLYQIFTHVKNMDSIGTGNVSGVLLYAKTDEELTPDSDFKIRGNRISVKTVDLGGDFTDINEHIHMLRNGRWQMMEEPLNFDRHVSGVGTAASFAQAWTEGHPGESIGVIPCAEGGSSLDDWANDGLLARHAISEAKFAMETSEIVGILWHQGESDSYRTSRTRKPTA